MNIFSFILDTLSDFDGNASSKRVITFLATLLLSALIAAQTWFGVTVTQETIDMLAFLVMAGLGVTSTEKFAPVRAATTE